MRRIAPVVMLLPLLACERAALDPGHAAAIRDSVRIMAEAIAQDLRVGGPVAWIPYFAKGPEFSMASDGRLVFPGSDSAEAFVRGLARSVARMDLVWEDLRVDPVAPGLAVLAAGYREVLVDTAGRETRFGGYFSGLAEHTRAGWRLRHLHWSSPPSVEEAPPR